MARSRERDYDYAPPSFDSTVDRAERKGSMFDTLFKDAKIYRAKQGVNLLRILPPGWPKASHYGLTVMLHRDVGPNDRQYLCLRENSFSPHKRCPICEELYKLGSRATQEDRQQLRPKANVVFYVVDRDNEKDGVQVWMASPTVDSEIAAQSINRRNKSVIDIVHPEDGYDIEFTRAGSTRNNTRYRGFQIMRESSPLSDSDRTADEWLDVAFDKPIPSLLQFYSPERIEEVFYGRAKEEGEETATRERTRDDDEQSARDSGRGRTTREEDERPRGRANGRDDDEERPLRRTRRVEPEPEEEERPRRRSAADRSAENDEETAETSRPPHPRARPRDDDATRDDDTPRETRSRERGGRAEPERDEERSARPRRGREPDDEDRPARATARRAEEPSEAAHEGRRERMRARLDRSRTDDLDDEIPF